MSVLLLLYGIFDLVTLLKGLNPGVHCILCSVVHSACGCPQVGRPGSERKGVQVNVTDVSTAQTMGVH